MVNILSQRNLVLSLHAGVYRKSHLRICPVPYEETQSLSEKELGARLTLSHLLFCVHSLFMPLKSI